MHSKNLFINLLNLPKLIFPICCLTVAVLTYRCIMAVLATIIMEMTLELCECTYIAGMLFIAEDCGWTIPIQFLN